METRVITIARQVGTGGEDVARIVAAATGYRLLDYRVASQEAARPASPRANKRRRAPALFTPHIIEALARNPATPPAVGAGSSTSPPLRSSPGVWYQLIQQIWGLHNRGRVVLLTPTAPSSS